MYTCAENSVCGVILPGLANTCPRSTSSFFVPRNNAPMLSPARPSSNSLRNISTPVHVVLVVGRNPMISISSPAPPACPPPGTRTPTTAPAPPTPPTPRSPHRRPCPPCSTPPQSTAPPPDAPTTHAHESGASAHPSPPPPKSRHPSAPHP